MTKLYIFSVLAVLQLNNSMCCPAPAFSADAPNFSISENSHECKAHALLSENSHACKAHTQLLWHAHARANAHTHIHTCTHTQTHLAQLRLVWLASTNKGHFKVGSSWCWPQQFCFRKKCCNICNTDLVLESKLEKVSVLWKFLAMMTVFPWEMEFQWI